MNHRQRIASTVVATISAATLTLGAAPAAFAGDIPSPAEQTAALVEKATGTTDIALTPAPGTTIPQRSTGDAKAGTATGDAVSIALPGTKNVTGAKAGKNTTVYPGAAEATDLAVQPTTDGGIRALAVLKDVTAPREQRYDVGLPAGARLVELDNGAVAAIAKNGTFLGGFTTPWAKDANGKPVPTSYRVDGNTLVQSVRIADSTAFPVVADPKWLNDAAKGTAAGLVGGCAAGALAGGVGCLPGAVASGVAGGVAGAISGLFG
ncbi:hypothetical protein OEIGOIKO_02343 [Streptomyces chrestomyceticus JCM 4735]|uniref:Uncharacterized protein n=1 Tax=Streptomyces chrestomyceticus JCM 4735 TaxID=1306181 RepID=A0A7U9KSH4_9ACTN|nr:hypothetical protein [Streptomyces chrestomyceticus]GCD34604.1 hypothetical protein OEIGOIKO_02343 [Streptomyces chrestomyceticus JCM 4735]